MVTGGRLKSKAKNNHRNLPEEEKEAKKEKDKKKIEEQDKKHEDNKAKRVLKKLNIILYIVQKWME